MFLYNFAETFEVVYVSAITFLHGENGFAEIFKNLDTDLKIILTHYQNNYVEHSNLLEYQIFLQHCSSCMSFLHISTYF